MFVLHMHVAAARGELSGNDPRDRYERFLDMLRQPATGRRLLERYPAMVRECQHVLRNWRASRLEFADHLLGDLPLIAQHFPRLRPETLQQVDFGHGDEHNSGRSVAILHFADGGKLVYKPRSLAVDERFQALLEWTTERGFRPSLAPLRVLDRGDHGWSEHVAHAPCQDQAEADRYYFRLGGQLALLHLVYARDVHRDNLIAAGEIPYVVDLEGLFHAEPRPDNDLASDAVLARQVVLTTVLATGLLPVPVGYLDGGVSAVSDLSAVSKPGQQSPGQVYSWQDRDTDRMRLRRQRVDLPPAQNVVRIGASPAQVGDHVPALEDGFAAMYRLLLEHRAELVAPDGPLAAFAPATTRVILRGTQFYGEVLYQTYHPDLLGDAADREHYLNQAVDRMLGIADEDRIIDSERRQLAGGDIPIFQARVDGTELVGGDGTRLPDSLERSGLAACLDRARALSEADLARQRWVIRTAVAATGIDVKHPSLPARNGAVGTEASGAPNLLPYAIDIGDMLLDQSVVVDGRRGARTGWTVRR